VRRHEIEAARAQLITARLLPNPQLVIDAMSPVREWQSADMTTRLMFTIPTGPKRRLRTAVAAAGVCERQWALGRETKLLFAEAADAAVEVLYLQELAAIEEQLAASAARLVETQKQRFTIAAAPYRNVILAEISANKVELARRSAAAALDLADVRLARAMGLAPCQPPKLCGRVAVCPLPSLPLETIVAQARAAAPELAVSEAALQRTQEQLALERWNAVPDLSLGPRVRDSLGREPDEQVGARFGIDLPIFDRNQGVIAETAAMTRANAARVAVAEINTLGDVTAAYTELIETQQRWEYFQRTVRPLLERTETTMQQAFEDRAVTAYELTDMLDAILRMRLSDLELRRQHQRLRTRLQIALECDLCETGTTGAPPPSAPPSDVPIPKPPEAPQPLSRRATATGT